MMFYPNASYTFIIWLYVLSVQLIYLPFTLYAFLRNSSLLFICFHDLLIITTPHYLPRNFILIFHRKNVSHQVFLQPIFAFYEKRLASRWPTMGFFHNIYTFRLPFNKSRSFQFTLCKLVLRSVFVVFTTLVAMMLPFFNAVLGLLGAMAFWPLTVYFPVTMYMAQAKIKRGTCKWVALQSLSVFALLVSLVSAVGSAADMIQHLKHAKVFHITY